MHDDGEQRDRRRLGTQNALSERNAAVAEALRKRILLFREAPLAPPDGADGGAGVDEVFFRLVEKFAGEQPRDAL